jgi:hypothetical protein
MSGGIFISYCRNDDSFLAGRLYARLLENFPQDKVFMDLDRVAHAEDLVKAIGEAIESSDILIAVIGKRWFTCGLEHLGDQVHLELAAAFTRNILVILVLREGASKPQDNELPNALKTLPRLHAWRISVAYIDADCGRIASAIHDFCSLLVREAASDWLVEEGRVKVATAYFFLKMFFSHHGLEEDVESGLELPRIKRGPDEGYRYELDDQREKATSPRQRSKWDIEKLLRYLPVERLDHILRRVMHPDRVERQRRAFYRFSTRSGSQRGSDGICKAVRC